jgi:hypothetical protein
MADFYSSEAPARTTKPTVARSANAVAAKLRRTVSSFVCDATNCGAAAAGSRLMLPRVPKGARGIKHRITVSATLGTSTLALGITGTTAKYAAAATYTTANSPVTIAKAANLAAELAADEDQFLTTAVAALPNDGTIIVVETEYTLQN